MKLINALGMVCPKPLILTKKELDYSDEKDFKVLVDNEVAVMNLEKFSKKNNLDFKYDKISDKEYHVLISRLDSPNSKVIDNLQNDDVKNTVLFITKDYMGDSADEDKGLGQILIKGYIYSVSEYEKLPKTIIFLNGGVKLTTDGSPCIEYLKEMEEKGVNIISCGTCLDYFGLKDKLLVGEISNMYTIYETLYDSDKVITI